MKKEQGFDKSALGAEIDKKQEYKDGNASTEALEPKKRAPRTPNTIYTLKQMRTMINKIAVQKMASVEELTQLRNIHKTMTERWIGLELKD